MTKHDKLEQITRNLLKEIGENPDREGLLKTPYRVAKTWKLFSKGYNQNLEGIINNAIFEEDAKDMVIVRDVEFFSLCEHHLLPFFGWANLVYIPNGKIAGISKLVRCLDVLSRRPQVQERLTSQWIDAVFDKLSPRTVAVKLQAEHLCMSIRGVEKPGTLMTTTAFRGDLSGDEIGKEELLRLLAG